jgi:flagellar motor switch protein FliG
MSEATQTDAPTLQASAMSKPQKLAALLVMLGPESAAQMLKHFDELEIESISTEMAKLSLLDQETQAEILREFSDVAVLAGTALRGGVDYTEHTLQKAIGSFKTASLVSRLAPQRSPVPAMRAILEAEPRHVLNLLRGEQPQTAALVLSYLPPDKASQVLALMPETERDRVVERLATLSPTPIEAVERVVQVLQQKGGTQPARALTYSGGVKSAADILNALDKNLSKMVLASMEERNPELVAAIQQKMFTFEDLARLESTALQRILREVDLRELAIALKAASDKVKTALLSNISRRAAETVKEEMNFLGALKAKDIEAAQTKVIEIVRRLEAEGEIDLGGGQGSGNAAAA